MAFARNRRASGSSPPLIVLLPSILVAAAVLLPLTYLLFRATGASGGFWAYLLRARSLTALWTTLALAFSVTTSTLLIALPVAWLTLRTDLYGRRVWFVLTMLPLVIPTYVGSFALISAFATGGLFSQLFGAELPNGVRLRRGTRRADAFYLSVHAAGLCAQGCAASTRALEEAARSLGYSPLKDLFHRDAAAPATSAIAGGSAFGLALRNFGLRCGGDAAGRSP